jgi:hypothetical protein
MAPHLRGECPQRGAPQPRLCFRDEGAELGANCFHQQRERHLYAEGNDSLRDDEDRPARRFTRLGGVLRWDGGHREFHSPRADSLRRLEDFVAPFLGGHSIEDFEKEFFRSVRPGSLIKRFETPDEIARLVTFVCSPVASGIAGAALRVEGGVVSSCF